MTTNVPWRSLCVQNYSVRDFYTNTKRRKGEHDNFTPLSMDSQQKYVDCSLVHLNIAVSIGREPKTSMIL